MGIIVVVVYYTTTTIPHIFHHKHTSIYIYTIQQLRYPISFITNTHLSLHLYYTTTTIPHIFHHKHTYIYIYTIQQLRYPISCHHKHMGYLVFILYNNYDTPYLSSQTTHIFTFILYNNYDTPYLSSQTHMGYLHLYYTTTAIPHILSSQDTHIFTFILYNKYMCVCDGRYGVSQLLYSINVNICVFVMKDMGYRS